MKGLEFRVDMSLDRSSLLDQSFAFHRDPTQCAVPGRLGV